ncbi:putative RNA methyltransferase [Herbidospora sp. NBRC 101105]|uniref:putative RNA methyltransferase n=1 Tax=Herbidospora sp. NBRC 101105 TaxID=3032195 RepID=UPI0024A3ED6A|nr:methyltransferase domain-containing protein [Herbidospora sp. NBRC 101105]GLX96392.1 ubiquinone biosynthesis protein [Herbidospora sp. NBRC 101105]
MLGDVIDLLVCPVCRDDLALAAGAARCPRGHSFDVARQGYLNLLSTPVKGDTPEMVSARETFLASGAFAPIAETVAARAKGVVGDAGAGTGYYLARAVHDRGLALDVSKHALKKAARAHPRIGAVVADVWKPLPVRDAAFDTLLNVFAPRNAGEFRRVLKPTGTLITVTPNSDHLAPIVARFGLLSVDDEKDRRLADTLGDHFARDVTEPVASWLDLTAAEVMSVIAMGPSAWHARAVEVSEGARVRLSVQVTVWRPKS